MRAGKGKRKERVGGRGREKGGRGGGKGGKGRGKGREGEGKDPPLLFGQIEPCISVVIIYTKNP